MTLIKRAADYRDRFPGRFDDTWCVIDVDQFDVASAAGQATRLKVNLAISNPCFEVWLLLHHEKCETHLANCKEVTQRLRKHLPSYDKTRLKFEDYAAGLEDAIERSRQLEPSGEDHSKNPSSGVWRLVERIVQ